MTEHPTDDGQTVAVVINQRPHETTAGLAMAEGWDLAETWRGETLAEDGVAAVRLAANDAAVLLLKRK